MQLEHSSSRVSQSSSQVSYIFTARRGRASEGPATWRYNLLMPATIESFLPEEEGASFYELVTSDTQRTASTIRQLANRGPVRLFVAIGETGPVARLVTQISPAYRDGEGNPLGLIGFFDAQNDPDAVSELFDAAAATLRQYGSRKMIGPIDGDTWHRYRVNAGPFETPPFLLEPWNPPYYAELWERSGFTILETYSSRRIDDVEPVAERLSEKFASARNGGYVFEPFDRSDFQRTLERIYRLSLEIFRDNYLYSDISFDDFCSLYYGADRLIEDDSIWFARAPDGSDAGFAFTYPNRTPKDPHGDALNFKTLGVLPAHRRGGTGAALMFCGYEAGLRRGFQAVNHCLMRAGNPSEKLDSGHGKPFREYFLYERAVKSEG